MAITTLGQIPLLYHFTDRRNLDSIREHGGLYPYSLHTANGIAAAAPGGNDWSHDADRASGVDGDVHLCFRNNHPMEYVARQDERIADTIYLQVSAVVLQWPGVRFTGDVSNKSGVSAIPIADAQAVLDFEVLYTRTDWGDPAIQSRLKQAEKCEVLVPHVIPLELIRNI